MHRSNMNTRAHNKGRAFRSLLTPLNASLITNARQKSPRKSPFRKAKKTKSKSYAGTLCPDKGENASVSGSWKETQAASTASEEHNVTTNAGEEAAESAPRLQSEWESSSKDNADLTVGKNKTYGGTLGSDKAENATFSGSWKETQSESISLNEHNVTTLEEAAEPAPRLRSKRTRSRKNNSELTVRKSEELLKSGNERHSDTAFVVQQNEAGLPKIDKQTNVEDSKQEELSNQTNSFNERPNQPKCSTDKNCDLTRVCITDSVTKNNVSTNFRNKRLDRELNTHDESLFKLSRATKLTGTINKERRNIERQQEKNLKNVTVRRKCPKPATELSNETIRIDEKKKTCSSASLVRKPFLRKKMPDFSAIHQQNFGKMESIVDHLDRKARRAIVLTTSTVKKAKPNMKMESTEKKSIVEHLRRRAQRTLVLTPSTTRKDSLDITENSSKKVPKSTYFAVRQRANSKSEMPTSTKDAQLKCVQKMDIKFDKTQSNNKSTQENINILQKSDSKFDNINAKKKDTQENVKILPKLEVSKAKVEELNSRMLEKRGLYKGKIEVSDKTRQKKNVEILRGVRSNRRFELQMKYRNSQN